LAALDLFALLPEDARRELGNLPAVVRALEEQVQSLRHNGQAGELREALGALETIRFDLLRLHGGAATLAGLTADLGAARQIGDRVDELLEGRREVDDALP
jgi:serine/threonine-protein kinase